MIVYRISLDQVPVLWVYTNAAGNSLKSGDDDNNNENYESTLAILSITAHHLDAKLTCHSEPARQWLAVPKWCIMTCSHSLFSGGPVSEERGSLDGLQILSRFL